MAMTLCGVVALAIPYIPSLSRLFSFKAPSAGEVGVVLSCSAVYIVVLDFVKVAYFKVAGDLRLVPMGSGSTVPSTNTNDGPSPSTGPTAPIGKTDG